MCPLRKTVFSFMYLNFSEFWQVGVGKCSGKEKSQGYERSGFEPELRFSFFLIKTLSIKGQKFSKCLKNGSDRLRRGQLRWRASLLYTFLDKFCKSHGISWTV